MCIYKCYMYVQGLGEATLFKEETRYPQTSRSHRWGHIDVNVVCEDHSMAHARRLSNVTAANKCIANGVCGVMAGHYGRRIICRWWEALGLRDLIRSSDSVSIGSWILYTCVTHCMITRMHASMSERTVPCLYILNHGALDHKFTTKPKFKMPGPDSKLAKLCRWAQCVLRCRWSSKGPRGALEFWFCLTCIPYLFCIGWICNTRFFGTSGVWQHTWQHTCAKFANLSTSRIRTR